MTKRAGGPILRYDDGKCLHYYFYFIDEDLGLCYTAVADWAAAQKLSDNWDPAFLHRKLDRFSDQYCPILRQIEESYRWSVDEAEYAADIVFRRQADLQAIYGNLIRTAIHTVKPDDIATFPGKKLNGNYHDEMGNRYNVRIEGTRVRHSMGMASIKMYDKFGQILRIETTAKDISFFKHYREVEQRNGEATMKFTPMKKTIYSLGALREVWARPTAATWSFYRLSTIPAMASTSSTKSRGRSMRRRGHIAVLTSSTKTTKLCS